MRSGSGQFALGRVTQSSFTKRARELRVKLVLIGFMGLFGFLGILGKVTGIDALYGFFALFGLCGFMAWFGYKR